ncbi:MAG: hypothetical protein OCC49_17310 [Fibrobacterales bacterium]
MIKLVLGIVILNILLGCYGGRPPELNRCVQVSEDGREVEERIERTLSRRPRRIYYVYRDPSDNWIQHGRDVIYYVKGSIKFEEHFFEGNKHGKSESWYESGGKQGELNYEQGKIDGKSFTWWPNGKKRTEKNWTMGVLNGSAIEWTEEGIKRSEIIWVNNKIIKKFKFDEKGRIITKFK